MTHNCHDTRATLKKKVTESCLHLSDIDALSHFGIQSKRLQRVTATYAIMTASSFR